MTVSYAEAMRKRQPTQQQELSTPAQHINPKRTSTNPWGTRVGTANLPVSADVGRMQNIPAQEKDSAWTTIAKSNPIKKQPIAILSRSNKAENPSTGSGKMSLASTAKKAKAANNKNRPSNKPKPTLRNMSINDLISNPSKKTFKGNKDQAVKAKLSSTSTAKISPNLQVDSTIDFPTLAAASPSLPTKKFATMKPSVKIQQQPQAKAIPKQNNKKPEKGNKKNTQTPSIASMFFKPQELDNRVGDGEEHKLLRLMQERTVYEKKGRQRLKPRKKKFTALKKKILHERLKKWRELHPEDDPTRGMALSNDSTKDTSSICLYNYASRDDLEDEDEYEEIYENLKEMASKVGDFDEIFVPRTLERDGDYPVFVKFKTIKDALAAKACWNDLIIGGVTLKAIALDESSVKDVDGGSWSDKMIAAESKSSQSKEAPNEMMDGPRQVIIEGVLTADDYDDEDCMEESIEYLHKLAEKFGKVSRICASSGKDGNVEVFCDNLESAGSIANGLCGTIISGNQLLATLVPITHSTEQDSKTNVVSIVELDNFLTKDDLEDEDCMEETLNDVRELAGKHGEIDEVIADGNTVKVSFVGDISVAENAVRELNGLRLGGMIVNARIVKQDEDRSSKDYIYLENLLTEDDLEDEDCLEESLEDIRQIVSKFGKVLDIAVDQKENSGSVRILYGGSPSERSQAMKELDGMVIGGQIISVRMPGSSTQDGSDESPGGGKRKTPVNGESAMLKKPRTSDPKPLYSGDKLIPEHFAECKRVPKVPNAAGPRQYAKIVNDDRVRPLLNEMLGELMRLQKRAVEDKNAKARRRIVMGLREVARGIRAHKVKMVVMANNLDEYGAIDQKLQEIIDLAEAEDVPLFFEFTKRSLGKAIGKSIKVAVVGIQNADGAHQPFKKLTAIASRI